MALGQWHVRAHDRCHVPADTVRASVVLKPNVHSQMSGVTRSVPQEQQPLSVVFIAVLLAHRRVSVCRVASTQYTFIKFIE